MGYERAIEIKSYMGYERTIEIKSDMGYERTIDFIIVSFSSSRQMGYFLQPCLQFIMTISNTFLYNTKLYKVFDMGVNGQNLE